MALARSTLTLAKAPGTRSSGAGLAASCRRSAAMRSATYSATCTRISSPSISVCGSLGARATSRPPKPQPMSAISTRESAGPLSGTSDG